MNKKIYIIALMGCLSTMAINAQQPSGQELNKEITLERDFVPVVKKVTKKNTLPKVKKITPPAPTNLEYSNTPVTIEVPTTIPTLEPYGYRTAHNFSDKRGYLEVGGGMAANFDGSAGYRFLDTDRSQAGFWIQHNSTWAGKNRSSYITDDNDRAKQVFNDNRGGLYLTNAFKGGVLNLNAGVHFDSFNYYGARKVTDASHFNVDKKQTFMEWGLGAGWKGNLLAGDHKMAYHVDLGFNHAGYNTTTRNDGKGASENLFNFTLGGSYDLENYGTILLDIKGNQVKKSNSNSTASFSYFYLTIAPRYKWENEIFRASVGADILLGDINSRFEFKDATTTKKFHVAPIASIDVDFIDGAAIFAELKGGNTINSISRLAALDRYSNPNQTNTNTWRPIDGEAGFKLGPFGGFSAKLFAGYGIAKGQLTNCFYSNYPIGFHVFNTYEGLKMRGFKIGAEFNYKYRSLVEANAAITLAPGGDYNVTGWTRGYSLGLDGARLVGNFNLKVTPITNLAIDLGIEYRGQRRYLSMEMPYSSTIYDSKEEYVDSDNMINLHAGASYRISKAVTVWARANNLLNRRYDIMPGQGAQGINAMAGVSLVF